MKSSKINSVIIGLALLVTSVAVNAQVKGAQRLMRDADTEFVNGKQSDQTTSMAPLLRRWPVTIGTTNRDCEIVLRIILGEKSTNMVGFKTVGPQRYEATGWFDSPELLRDSLTTALRDAQRRGLSQGFHWIAPEQFPFSSPVVSVEDGVVVVQVPPKPQAADVSSAVESSPISVGIPFLAATASVSSGILRSHSSKSALAATLRISPTIRPTAPLESSIEPSNNGVLNETEIGIWDIFILVVAGLILLSVCFAFFFSALEEVAMECETKPTTSKNA